MSTDYMSIILLATGIFTAIGVLQFVFPKFFLSKLFKIKMQDESSLFFARHWGILVFVIGALIIFSAFNTAIRVPVLIAATIEKAGLVVMVLSNFRKEFVQGLILTAIIDTVCCILYILYLTGII